MISVNFKSLGSCKVIVSAYINDYDTIKRSWFERLFSIPWKPQERYKAVYAPKVYRIGSEIMCSPQTAQKIHEAFKDVEM